MAVMLTCLLQAFVTGNVLVVDGEILASGTEQRVFVTKLLADNVS